MREKVKKTAVVISLPPTIWQVIKVKHVQYVEEHRCRRTMKAVLTWRADWDPSWRITNRPDLRYGLSHRAGQRGWRPSHRPPQNIHTLTHAAPTHWSIRRSSSRLARKRNGCYAFAVNFNMSVFTSFQCNERCTVYGVRCNVIMQ